MEATPPEGKKNKYKPKARIFFDKVDEECAVETCMDSFKALFGGIDKHTKWQADAEPTVWSWVD